MEKLIHKSWLLLAALFSLTASAQDYQLQIRLTDGTTRNLSTSQIARIEFRQNTPPTYEGLTGKWMLIASPAGLEGDGGIHTTTIDTIRFTAILSDDATYLACHADTLRVKDNTPIAADWQMLVAEQNGTRRLGWVLTTETPVATYSNNLYFLSENIQTGRLEGMTLWSDWVEKEGTTYKFPQNQEIYGVWSDQKPYRSALSFLEIWASARFVKL